MTTNEKIIFAIVIVALIVFVFILFDMHSDCLADGGQFVRGIFWFECVK